MGGLPFRPSHRHKFLLGVVCQQNALALFPGPLGKIVVLPIGTLIRCINGLVTV